MKMDSRWFVLMLGLSLFGCQRGQSSADSPSPPLPTSTANPAAALPVANETKSASEAAAPALSGKRCLLVGAPPGTENADYDRFIIPKLQEWGYGVDKKHEPAAVAKYSDAELAAYDFIFLSETTASDHAAALRTIPKPMVNSDGWTAKEASMGFGAGKPVGILEPAKPVVFLSSAAGHPLAAGHASNQVVEFCEVREVKDRCLLVWGKPTVAVIPIAGVAADPSQLMVYGIEKGTKNTFGEAIRNRVAVVGVHAFGYQTLTDSGVKAFRAAIEWVTASSG